MTKATIVCGLGAPRTNRSGLREGAAASTEAQSEDRGSLLVSGGALLIPSSRHFRSRPISCGRRECSRWCVAISALLSRRFQPLLEVAAAVNPQPWRNRISDPPLGNAPLPEADWRGWPVTGGCALICPWEKSSMALPVAGPPAESSPRRRPQETPPSRARLAFPGSTTAASGGESLYPRAVMPGGVCQAINSLSQQDQPPRHAAAAAPRDR